MYHLRDGGLFMSAELTRLINNRVKIIPPKAGKPRRVGSENVRNLYGYLIKTCMKIGYALIQGFRK